MPDVEKIKSKKEYIDRYRAIRDIAWYATTKERSFGTRLLTLDEVIGVLIDVVAVDVMPRRKEIDHEA